MTRRPRSTSLPLACAALFAFVCPAAGVAQDEAATVSRGEAASPYLPLDHWGYPALELWIARGDITDLSPMTRPYRISDVRSALHGLADAALSRTEEEIRRRMLAELENPDDARTGPWLELLAEAGARYVSQTHPDPLQPVLDGDFGDDHVFEGLEFGVRGAVPYVAGAASLRSDGIYRNDPRFPDGRVTPPREAPLIDDLSVRLEEAYLELQIPYFRASFGRLDREWGPATIHGFLRSSNPYSQDEIGYRVGTERVFLIGSISAPADFGADTVRHLAMHRLEIRPSDRLAFSISEAALHGGPEGRFRFELANPVGIWQLAVDDTVIPYNKVGQVDAWWRAAKGVTLNGSLLADATGGGVSCCQMGGSLGVELTRLAPALRVGLQATALQSLVYRTARPWEEYSVQRVGLGWDKSDLELFTIEADWFVIPSLTVGPRIDVQRRGEGDFRQPRPADLSDQPTILSGVVETTVRPAIAGRYADPLGLRLFVEWDLGVSRITNYGHSEGDDRTVFTGSVAVRLQPPRTVFPVP